MAGCLFGYDIKSYAMRDTRLYIQFRQMKFFLFPLVLCFNSFLLFLFRRLANLDGFVTSNHKHNQSKMVHAERLQAPVWLCFHVFCMSLRLFHWIFRHQNATKRNLSICHLPFHIPFAAIPREKVRPICLVATGTRIMMDFRDTTTNISNAKYFIFCFFLSSSLISLTNTNTEILQGLEWIE